MKNEMLENYFEIMNDSSNPLSEYYRYIYENLDFNCMMKDNAYLLNKYDQFFTKLKKDNRLNELSIDLLKHIIEIQEKTIFEVWFMLEMCFYPNEVYEEFGGEYYDTMQRYVFVYSCTENVTYFDNPFYSIFFLTNLVKQRVRYNHFFTVFFSKLVGYYWLHHDRIEYRELTRILNIIDDHLDEFENHCNVNGFFDQAFHLSTLRDKEEEFLASLFQSGDKYVR